ncbi:ERAP1 C domain containing protein, partial [Asbolus verrucosus]
MNKLYNSVPITKTDMKNQIDILKQAKAVAWACRLNNTECVNNSKRIFSAYKNGTSVNKNLKVAIYCTALRHSDNVEEDWNFMWNKFQETKIATEQVTILWSLGCTTNEELLIKYEDEYLHHAINESSQIRRQDSTLVFSSVISGHSDGFKIALRFLTANYQLMLS